MTSGSPKNTFSLIWGSRPMVPIVSFKETTGHGRVVFSVACHSLVGVSLGKLSFATEFATKDNFATNHYRRRHNFSTRGKFRKLSQCDPNQGPPPGPPLDFRTSII